MRFAVTRNVLNFNIVLEILSVSKASLSEILILYSESFLVSFAHGNAVKTSVSHPLVYIMVSSDVYLSYTC